jgi:hypothetical protein
MKIIKMFPLLAFLLVGFCHLSLAQDWPNLKRYKKANATLQPPPAGQTRVVFMGNSITDLWDQIDP